MSTLADDLRECEVVVEPRVERPVTVLMTVRNDAVGCATTLSSLAVQTRKPDEIVIVDGGSTDETVRVIRRYFDALPQIRIIEAPGANIARGRNIGTAAATHEIIATTDAGCRAEPDWLANLIRPFEDDPQTEFVAGYYRVAPQTLLEEVAGGVTMRGSLDPVCPESFNPSARSMAYTKALWSCAGGWPDWIRFSEDTLWDYKIRAIRANWKFAGDAIVAWRPRTSVRQIARQFFNYGTGRGHTQLQAGNFMYNLRNFAFVTAAAILCAVTPWMLPVLAALLVYFYVWTFHDKAVKIAGRCGRWVAYPLSLSVIWLVMASRTIGYLVGSWQRWRDDARYRVRTELYLATS